MQRNNVVFITGTDTGVGKTLATALILQHLRGRGIHAVASKPFCSGGLEDVELLQSLQGGELSHRQMNPYYFKKQVAPLVELQEKGRKIRLKAVVGHLKKLSAKCDILLVEGAGGLLVPLGTDFFVIDLMAALNCSVLLVSRNRLGTINHTLLSLKALQTLGNTIDRQAILMMSEGEKDPSMESNLGMIQRFAKKLPVFSLPFLGKKVMKKRKIIKIEKNFRAELEQITRVLVKH